MPRFHPDSDSDYSPRRHRSPIRRSPTPGPRRARDLSPDDHYHHHPQQQHHPHFDNYEPHTLYPPVASGAAGRPIRPRSAGPGPGPSTGTTFTSTGTTPTTTLTTDSTVLAHRNRGRDRIHDRRRGSRSSSSSSFSSSDEGGRKGKSRRPPPPRRHSSSHTALHKARGLISNTFTPSTSGLGVGVLGAIVGGLAAREASEKVGKGGGGSSHGRGRGDRDKHHMLSTVVGAAVGGLGANALEKRMSGSRERERDAGRHREEGGRYRDDGRYREEGGRWRDEGGRRSGEWRRY